MEITIVDVVTYLYPGQFEAGNVSFYGDPDVPGGINIGTWAVEGAPKPSIQSLVDLFPTYQKQYDNMQIFITCKNWLAGYLDSVAQERQYSTAVSCTSYAASTNAQWAKEAAAFIAWRDKCFEYSYDYIAKVQQGIILNPNLEEFISGLPLMAWPTT